MKLIISKDGVKRFIETPFALAASREDLKRLGEHLIGLAAYMESRGTAFSFMSVDPDHQDKTSPNTPPLEWTDVGDKYR